MKKIFISVLFAGLFLTANSVWASGDNKKEKAPVKAKVENTEKKACPEKKDACCDKKEAACCADKKATSDKKTCCADKKADTACTKKDATSATKSSGKKAN